MDVKDTIEKVFSYDKVSNRYFELIKRGLPLIEIEAICYYVIDKQIRAGEIRTNRPEPTMSAEPTYDDKKTLESVRAMNISDADWISRLNQYKKDVEVGLVDDHIKLTAGQKGWVEFIEGKIHEPPVKKTPIGIKKDIDEDVFEIDATDIPF